MREGIQFDAFVGECSNRTTANEGVASFGAPILSLLFGGRLCRSSHKQQEETPGDIEISYDR